MDNSTLNKKFHSFVRGHELTKKWKKNSKRKFTYTFDDYELSLSLAQPRASSEQQRTVTLLLEVSFTCSVEPEPRHRFDTIFHKSTVTLLLALNPSRGIGKLNRYSSFSFNTESELDEFFELQHDAISKHLALWMQNNNSLSKALEWYKTIDTAFWIELFLNGVIRARESFISFMVANKGYRVDEKLATWLTEYGIINNELKRELFVASLQSEDILEEQISRVIHKVASIKTEK